VWVVGETKGANGAETNAARIRQQERLQKKRGQEKRKNCFTGRVKLKRDKRKDTFREGKCN